MRHDELIRRIKNRFFARKKKVEAKKHYMLIWTFGSHSFRLKEEEDSICNLEMLNSGKWFILQSYVNFDKENALVLGRLKEECLEISREYVTARDTFKDLNDLTDKEFNL